ncbi:hypothetical protein M885DRAFT_553606 [Pelagophyceae sp. CCMP2097]|nr:hypothetical protein M885DRAFT_553606 [Pelagophyceae sp. CCMP2097]
MAGWRDGGWRMVGWREAGWLLTIDVFPLRLEPMSTMRLPPSRRGTETASLRAALL